MHGLLVVVESEGYSLVEVCGLLNAVASFVVERGLQGAQVPVVRAGTWAHLSHGMWHLPRSGIELVFSALAGRFFTIGPLQKSLQVIF